MASWFKRLGFLTKRKIRYPDGTPPRKKYFGKKHFQTEFVDDDQIKDIPHNTGIVGGVRPEKIDNSLIKIIR